MPSMDRGMFTKPSVSPLVAPKSLEFLLGQGQTGCSELGVELHTLVEDIAL